MRIVKPWELRNPDDDQNDFVRLEYGYDRSPPVIAQVEYLNWSSQWYWSFVYESYRGYTDNLKTAKDNVDRLLLAGGWKLLDHKHMPFT